MKGTQKVVKKSENDFGTLRDYFGKGGNCNKRFSKDVYNNFMQ